MIFVKPFVLFCFFIATLWSVSSAAVTPPGQPSTGPGSDVYPHSFVNVSSHGSGDLKYWLYEPALPTPVNAPVLLYLHGWSADQPGYYHEMMTHFARKGYIVVFPKYGNLFNLTSYEANAKTAFENALVELQTNPARVAPDLSKVVFAGHSLGNQIASRMADTAASFNYPAPKALIMHEPAGTSQLSIFDIDNNMNNVSSDTLLAIILRDDWVTDPGGYPVPVTIWNATEHLTDRTVLRVPNDTYGDPDLISAHETVSGGWVWFVGTIEVDAIDTWGYWRPTEAAINYALYGTDSQYIIGNGADVIDMGNWSDGTPVVKKEVISDATMDALYDGL